MRLIASFVVALVVNGVALLLAAALLDGFSIDTFNFPIVLLVFTVILLVARAALETVIDEHVQVLASFVGLVAAFVTLLVTDLFSDGISIEGISTWFWATLIVWGGSLIVALLFAKRITRRIAGERRA